ncbi:MAG: methyltransferase domain-containing protein [Thalassobaculum sp.]|uniref:class I SAM-dependent methyltransferase n=1 Tax=Thalassobaculum sp. TaxID=2022740 RepID=UPI0032EBA6DC
MRTILHVGCGRQSHDALPPLNWENEWRQVRIDIDPAVEPDIVASIVDMAGIEDGSAECVFSKHNIEHLEAHEVPQCLAAFHRVLRPEGFLILRTPDLRSIARLLLKYDPEEPLYTVQIYGKDVRTAPLDMLYGLRQAIAGGNGFMAHRTGFTAASLRRHLLRAGFERIEIIEKQDTHELNCLAMKRVDGNLLPGVLGLSA